MSDREEQQALASLRSLVEYVFAHRDGIITPVFYQELALRIGRVTKHGDGHGHGMGRVLAIMGHLLTPLKDNWGNSIPHIQSLVALKTGALRGLPDEGIQEFWYDYPKLSRTEKEDRTRIEYQKIVAFGSRWNDVLEKLGLEPLVANPTAKEHAIPQGAGGESDEHKALKDFVRKHPAIVQATDEWDSIVEYPLPSLDLIDVLFRTREAITAVEVKSSVSDEFPKDFERGIFQIIKYRALLEAMAKNSSYGIPPTISAYLVLESNLPNEYRLLAQRLDVCVIENVRNAVVSDD